jgi:two-component system sensor histidine kinase AlgZ
MHPILADSRALLLYLFVFFLIGLVVATLIAIPNDIAWSGALAFAVPMSLLYGLVCLSSWYVCRSFPLRKTSPARLVAVYGAASLVTGALWTLTGYLYSSLLNNIPFAVDLFGRYVSVLPLIAGVGVGLYLLSVAIHYLVIVFEASQETERRALELRIHAQSAELKALHAQINPHFLFNSLNSISALTTKNPGGARTMLLLLADFLRQTLRFGTVDFISLRDEISLCDNFLEIERVRFGSRLAIQKDITDEALSATLPPLLLQPLIENAINHGIAHLVDGGTISMRAVLRNGRLRIDITNPCDPDRPKTRGNSLGLENVRNRLRALYSGEGRLDVSEDNGIFRVEVALPSAAQ